MPKGDEHYGEKQCGARGRGGEGAQDWEWKVWFLSLNMWLEKVPLMS